MSIVLSQAGAIRHEAELMSRQPKVAAFKSMIALAVRDRDGMTEETDAQELADLLSLLLLPEECYAALLSAVVSSQEIEGVSK